jgi:protein associated with RNAse G/E
VLDITNNFIVCGNNKTRVTEIDGREWSTKEPALVFFYKDKWFNIIAQFKERGIFYYCNIQTPYIIEESTIKYIDYDIDLRVFPDSTFRVLDKSEYEYH